MCNSLISMTFVFIDAMLIICYLWNVETVPTVTYQIELLISLQKNIEKSLKIFKKFVSESNAENTAESATGSDFTTSDVAISIDTTETCCFHTTGFSKISVYDTRYCKSLNFILFFPSFIIMIDT